MRLAQDVSRRAPRPVAAPSIGEATAIRDGASVAAAAAEAAADAVSGDLEAANPQLAAKLASIERRLDAVEP